MDSDPRYRAPIAKPELIEIDSRSNSDGVPALQRPVAHLCSPVTRRRAPASPPKPRVDGPSVRIPPAPVLIRSFGLALVAAGPCLPLLGWQPAVIMGGIVAVTRLIDGRISRLSFRFGDGFVPPTNAHGWPRGVQEDDEIRWNWSRGPRAGTARAADLGS